MLFFLWAGCSQPEGLTPVSGVEGTLRFDGVWPASVFGATILALDSDISSDPEHPSDYLVSYSDPAMKGDTLLNYFIQLKPGAYYLVGAGVTVEPSFFITKLDSFLSDTVSLPIAFFEHDIIGNVILHPLIIIDEKITRNNSWDTIHFTD